MTRLTSLLPVIAASLTSAGSQGALVLEYIQASE